MLSEKGPLKSFSSKASALLQKLGQSLMVPVSVLPAAGLLIALGRLLQEQKDSPKIKGIGDVVSKRFIEMFEAMDKEYMRERALDIEDVSSRVISKLLNIQSQKYQRSNRRSYHCST